MSDDKTKTAALFFAEDARAPNNPDLPMMVYRAASAARDEGGATVVEALFAANGWGGLWRNGVYPFDHYHSTCHEALGVARGWAEVRFGGDGGETLRLEIGDVVVLPAGTGHRRIAASDDFLIVGAYPPDQPYDMIRGDDGEQAAARERIAEVSIPANDPVFGADGGLKTRWSRRG